MGDLIDLEHTKMYFESTYVDSAKTRQAFAWYAYEEARACGELHEKKVMQRRARDEWLMAVGAREMGL